MAADSNPVRSLLGWLARRQRPAAAAPPAIDLIGEPAQPSDEAKPAQPEPWSFQQPVLLRRSVRPTSVIVWTVVGSTGLLLLWSVLAPLGETVAVQGKLLPGRRVKRVEAPVAGVVAELLVKEGQSVKAGQLLMRFDLRQVRSQLTTAEAVRARLLSENRIYSAALGERAAAGLTANQRLQLNNQALQLRSSRQVATEEWRQSEQRLAGLRQSWLTASNIARRYRTLGKAGAVSVVQELQTQASADQLLSQIREEQRASARLQANLEQVKSAPGAELRGRIETNLRQISELDGQIRQARLQIQFGQLRAPVDGVVFDVRVSPSSVVEATTALLALVPGGTLEARVLVPSRAIGFIRAGMNANISLDTFPANDYGRLPATVRSIGSDALTPEEMRSALGTEANGLFYPVMLQLQRQVLQARRRRVPLKAGMTLTADIQLRQRPFISVLTSAFDDKLRSLERLR